MAGAEPDRPLFAIALMLGAYFAFSVVDTSVKWLALAGLPVLQLSFMRYIGHFAMSLGVMARDGAVVRHFRSGKTGVLIVRGVLLMLSTVFNFEALRHIPLTLTSTIMFSSPIIICAASWPLLGERVGVWRWSAIMVGFAGVLIAMQPLGSGFHWATLLSLAGACSFSGYVILTRRLSGVVPTDTMQFYSGVVGTLVLFPLAVAEWLTPDGPGDWLLMIVIGVAAWLGHQLLTTAHRFAPANALSPYSYAFILYLTVWSYLIFDEVPQSNTILGALVVVAAGLVIWMRERHLATRGKA